MVWSSIQCGPIKEPLLIELSAVLVAQKESLKLNVHIAIEMSVYDNATTDKNFCLKKCLDDTLRLDHAHSYYYQVQTQIIVCGVEYCDFVLCTFPENNEPEIFCKRIQLIRISGLNV